MSILWAESSNGALKAQVPVTNQPGLTLFARVSEQGLIRIAAGGTDPAVLLYESQADRDRNVAALACEERIALLLRALEV